MKISISAGTLTILLAILKTTGVINWPWLWVLCPIWITLAICAVIILVAIIIAILDKD